MDDNESIMIESQAEENQKLSNLQEEKEEEQKVVISAVDSSRFPEIDRKTNSNRIPSFLYQRNKTSYDYQEKQ